MKTSLKLIVTIAVLFIFSGTSFSQPFPQYTLEVKNSDIIDPNTMVFDLVFTHTDAVVWELAGWQFFFWAPAGLGNFPPGVGAAS